VAYITQDDLLQRITMQELIQLTDDNKPPAAVNPSVVGAAIADGCAAVDSYCRNRYAVPLQPSNDVVRITRDIAVYELYSRRPQKMPEVVRQRYVDVMALLKDISVGKASLDQPVGSEAPQVPMGTAVLPRCTGEVFSDCNLEGFCK
jgi:phage gp36-like protein